MPDVLNNALPTSFSEHGWFSESQLGFGVGRQAIASHLKGRIPFVID
jgi:hypothetical protein